MKAATLHQLKKELELRSPAEVAAICLRLAKYKAENKELLTYLLLEADDEESYIAHIKGAIDEQMEAINDSTVYFAKKGLRKAARMLQKWVRYSGIKTTEVELRLHFCRRIRESGLPVVENKVMTNLYNRQLERIAKAISTLHPDLQYDYLRELEGLAEQ